MSFTTPKEELTTEEIESGLKYLIKDGLASQALATLTGGAFQVAFALRLGATNFHVGLLAAIPLLSQSLRIPATMFVEKYRQRKAIAMLAMMLGRPMWLFIALIPLFFEASYAVAIFLIALLLCGSFDSVAGCSWSSWTRDLVPEQRLGSFFGRRMTYATALAIILSLGAGAFVDGWKAHRWGDEIYSYTVLFIFGFLAGMSGVYFLAKISEPAMPRRENKSELSFGQLVSQPWRDQNYKRLIIFLSVWSFAVNLAAPFFTVYMLEWLKLDMSLIIVLMILNQLMNLFFLGIWGKLSDRFSNKSVLAICGPMFIFCILIWTFTTLPEKHRLTLPLLIFIYLVMGISTAGVTLGSSNIVLKLAPKGRATNYLAVNSLMTSVAAGISPIIGGALADFFAKRSFSITVTWVSPETRVTIPALVLSHWDFFFLLAFILGLMSLQLLAFVEEKGHVKESVVLRELLVEIRESLRALPSATGLRQILQIPFSNWKNEDRKL